MRHTIWSGPAFTVTAGLIVIVSASLAGGHGPPEAELMSVSVTCPAAISAALGVYIAFSAERPGLNVPVPPFQVPVDTVPETLPLSATCGLVEHTAWSGPAFTTVLGSMVITIWSLTAGHGPLGSLVVSVRVTLPAAISAAVGVYVALRAVGLGLNVPAPPLQVPIDAPPPMLPASCTCGLLAHTRASGPAFTVAAGEIVITL